MAFREAVVAEALDLVEAALGEILRVAAAGHALDHLRAVIADGAVAAEGGHGAAEPIGLGGGELRRIHGDLHGLFLEERHAEGALQDLFQLVAGPCPGDGEG